MATRLLALVGPTASGKSEAALEIAERLGAEIVSVDSMTVYRGMDVGTAKLPVDERHRVPHHLFDVAEPNEDFSVARYQELALAALREIAARDSPALLAGGTGLYFRAVVDELEFPGTDPDVRRSLEAEAELVGAEAMHRRLQAADPAAAVTGRSFSSFAERWNTYGEEPVRAAGVRLPSDALRERIARRVRAQFDGGLLDETRGLLAGSGLSGTARQAIGYAEAIEHLSGLLTLDAAAERTSKRTRELARRQMAWFRRDPRIRWFDADERGAVALVDELTEYLRAD